MNDKFDPFDIEKLKLAPELVVEIDEARARKQDSDAPAKVKGITFVKFPKIWWEALAKARAGGSAYRLALWLLYEAVKSKPFRTGPPIIRLSNAGAERWGVGRRGKAIALDTIRKAGLVAVEERPKKSPLVTVRFTD
jgi:hypothetical protein